MKKFKSNFGENYICENNWAVSLLCEKGSNHAILIFEILNDEGKLELRKAHLKSQGNDDNECPISFRQIDFIPQHEEKVLTWIKPKSEIERIFVSILNQINKPELWPKFSIFGKGSVFSNPSNRLAKTARSTVKYSFPWIGNMLVAPHESMTILTLMAICKFNGITSPYTFAEPVFPNKNTFFSSPLIEEFAIKLRGEIKDEVIKDLNKVIEKTELEVRQNCITWVRDQLATVNINLSKNIDEFFFISTRYYTNPEETIPVNVSSLFTC